MIKARFVIVILLFFNTLNAQISTGNFHILNLKPYEPSYRSIYFINENTGWVSGQYIIKTTDGGNHWIYQNTGSVADYFYGLQMINENTGYALLGEAYYKTTNGGKNWISKTLQFPKYFYLRTMKFFDENTGFISTKQTDDPWDNYGPFVMFKTTNGGINWTTNQWELDSSSTGSTYFYDANTWYVPSIDNFLYKTTDAGISWDTLKMPQPEPYGYTVTTLNFINKNTGYCVVSNYPNRSFVYKTTNGGLNWTGPVQNISMQDYYTNILFVNENIGFVFGSRIFKTTNSGNNWLMIDSTNYRTDAINYNSNKIYRSSGWDFNVSSNYGETWVNKSDNARMIDVLDIVKIKGNLFMGGTTNSTALAEAYKSSDNGNTWHQINKIAASKFDFVDENTGYSVSHAGSAVYKTINSGNNWMYINTQHDSDQYKSIDFFDSNTGAIGGMRNYNYYEGILMITTNGGNSWNRKIFPNVNFSSLGAITKVQFLSQNKILILGQKLLLSTNLGINWTTLEIPQGMGSESILGFHADSENVIYVTKYDGNFNYQLVKTTNGGEYWRTINNSSGYISGITKRGEHLYMYGDVNDWNYSISFIEHSTNNGESWSPKVYINAVDINKMYFSGDTSYIVGRRGLILSDHSSMVDIKNINTPAFSYKLYSSAYPNPFNPETNIKFSLPKNGEVIINIFDITGRKIKTLLNGFRAKGEYNIKFHADNLSSGIYFYRVEFENETITNKLVLLK